MKTAAIIGFGRFGELLGGIARDSFDVTVYDPNPERQEQARANGYRTIDLPDVSRSDLTFLAVPISSFALTVAALKPHVTKRQLIVDVCSVKVHPAKIMVEELSECELIATHPMFGPDSAARGLTELKLAFCPLAASPENQNMVRYFWETKGVEVIETTPEEHDRQAAYSQAMPYIIAHALNGISLPELTFPTRSSQSLYDIARYSAKDSEQLFRDMLAYNPFVQAMLDEFEPSMTGMLELARNIAGTSV